MQTDYKTISQTEHHEIGNGAGKMLVAWTHTEKDLAEQVKTLTERLNLNPYVCEVCFTCSFEPCRPEETDAIQNLTTSEWMRCAYCALEKQTRGVEEHVVKLREALQEMQLQVERMDLSAITLEGDDGFITGYQFKTGAWHAMLGMIRGGLVSQTLAALHVNNLRILTNALYYELKRAEEKYGYTDGWTRTDWRVDLIAALRDHVQRNKVIGAIAFMAFAWHHHWDISDMLVLPKDISD